MSIGRALIGVMLILICIAALTQGTGIVAAAVIELLFSIMMILGSEFVVLWGVREGRSR